MGERDMPLAAIAKQAHAVAGSQVAELERVHG